MSEEAAAASTPSFHHDPVMVERVVEVLGNVPPGVVVDATLGGAGHSMALLDAHDHLAVVGFDADAAAVSVARARLARFADRAVVENDRFDRMTRNLARRTDLPVVGVLFDLGVSSYQLDTADRGFSYRHDGPLDMRMDTSSGLTAADVVNTVDAARLAEMFAANGESVFAMKIARAIVAARPLSTTGELAAVIVDAIPARARRTGGHPAKRIFQALRIAVNLELDVLTSGLSQALDLVVPGGRIVAISYQSGEDRIVKTAFAKAITGGCTCPAQLGCVCGAYPRAINVFRGITRPSPEEVERNRRAEAAKMRAIEILDMPLGA